MDEGRRPVATVARAGPAHEFMLYRRMLGATVRSQMQYRTSFAFQLISAMLITFVEFGAIVLVLQRFGGLGGWSLGEVAFLYGMVASSFKTTELIAAGFDPQDFGEGVRLGQFDQLLLRPVGLATQILGGRLDLYRVGQIVESLVILAIGIALADPEWNLQKAAYLPLVYVGQMAFFGGLFVIGATITFWTIESIEAMNMLTYGGQEMMSYPMHIYQAWLRRFFTFVVPAIFLNYYPILFVLERPDPLGLPAWAPFVAPLVGVLTLVLAAAFWRFGLRRYQSTGS